jgi:hypothetical protein
MEQEQAAHSLLASWEAFNVIVGPAAAVLIGLQFVAITLSAEANTPGAGSAIGAFSTPTIVHFCAVLFIAAMLSAPWPTLSPVALLLGACAVVGLAYTLLVVRRARRQTAYVPVLEDWIWHAALPLIAYAILLVAALLLQLDPATILFVIGGMVLLLLFIGIHNVWDGTVYVAIERRQQTRQGQTPPAVGVAAGEDQGDED